MKSVRIRSYSGPFFPSYSDQNNSEKRHFLRSVIHSVLNMKPSINKSIKYGKQTAIFELGLPMKIIPQPNLSETYLDLAFDFLKFLKPLLSRFQT